MKVIVFLLLTALLGAFPMVPAVAAHGTAVRRCAISNFEAEYKKSEAVFIGVVTAVAKEGDKKIFEFRVERFWKGVTDRNLKVSVYENPKFQAQFRADGRFLVFAKADEEGGLIDGRCSRSKDLDRDEEYAEEDIEKLGPGTVCEGDGKKCGPAER